LNGLPQTDYAPPTDGEQVFYDPVVTASIDHKEVR
jgi:hypothetical protein